MIGPVPIQHFQRGSDGTGCKAGRLLGSDMRVSESPLLCCIVRATWDDEANVWVAEGTNLPDGIGLATDASTLEAKIPGMVRDLLKGETIPPVEIVAKVRDRAVRSPLPKPKSLTLKRA